MRLAKCYDPSAPRVCKIKLDTGMVGILGLDLIMNEVRLMEPLSEEDAKNELLQRAASNNYIPGSAREKYAEALYREYVNKLNQKKGRNNNTATAEPATIKILGTGCKKCAKLEKIIREALAELNRALVMEKLTDLGK